MRKLRLIKGLSYTMKGFTCVSGTAFEADDDLADKLLRTGRFEEMPVQVPDGDPAGEQEEPEPDVLSADAIAALKKDELIALAARRGINIADCRNNEERISRIQGALGLASFVQMGLES